MQNSRLANIGYKSLKTRSNMPLLQQISLQQFSEGQPIKNTSTLYLDENGRQRQLSQLNSPTLNNKSSLLRKKSSRNQAELADAETNDKDMYALPVVNQRSDKTRDAGVTNLRDRALEESKRSKMVSSQYVTDRKQRKTHMDVVKQLDQSGHRSLLSIKRPKGFTRRPKMQQIDFIGGNLYEVEDIISDISKIIDRSSRKNMVITHKQEKHPLKTNKWLNKNFGGLSKLDEMLLNYKSIPDNEPSIPISQAFYRDSTYAKRDVQTPANKGPQIKSKFDSNSEFVGKGKIQKQQKFSMVVIKWNQMPIIGCKWDQSLFLKLQSFPQQDEYRKVVLKAYDQKIKSYSIFFTKDAGLKQPKKNMSNDKNKGQPTLMSQQQYVNHWQANLPQCSLSQQQKQLLMQFDVEWYRTLIQLCYHSGLQDLLQKNYDINGYIDVLARIQRLDDISSALVINNQMLYLRAYFQHVYPCSLYETLLGLIRVKNDDGMPVKDVRASFVQLIGQDAADQFCAWPIKQDQSQLLLILQLCGQRSASHISFSQDQSLLINMSNPTTKQPYSYTLHLTNSMAENKKKDNGNQEQEQQKNENRIMFKPDQQNDWQLFIKMENDIVNSIKYELKTVQELLFGVVYGLDLTAV